VLRRGTQVLPDGQQVTRHTAQITHGSNDFSGFFPKPHHQTRLGAHGGVALLDALQEFQRASVPGLWPDFVVQARNAFQVVIEDVRARFHYLGHSLPVAFEVGDEHLHPARWQPPTDGTNRLGKNVAAAIAYVVAIHRGDHSIAQVEQGNGLGNALGFLLVQPAWTSGLDGAETTTPGTGIA
jgi:hypothetical protein